MSQHLDQSKRESGPQRAHVGACGALGIARDPSLRRARTRATRGLLAPIILVAALAALLLLIGGCREQPEMHVFDPGTAEAAALSGPDPTVTLAADKTAVRPGDDVVFTSELAVPASEPKPARNVRWTYTPPAGFTLQQAIGPLPTINQAGTAWEDDDGNPYSGQSNMVIVVALDKVLSVTPDANGQIEIPCGDMKPGEQRTVALTVRYGG